MNTSQPHEITQWIKTRALELGFAAAGIARAEFLDKEEDRFDQWILLGYQGEMEYLTRNRDKRLDPSLLLPGAKSVISVIMNYFPGQILPEENNYKIAKYAYGKDYHLVIREKLNQLINELRSVAIGLEARAFTDSAPVLDKAWAEKAGLGWIGKNTCLIHPKLGSFVFIGEIITNLELEYEEQQVNDLCGGCTRCIDACPTGAIIAARVLDANKCISYLTIEYRGDLHNEKVTGFDDWIFGCDICQDVCPWNRKAQPHSEADFSPVPGLKDMDKDKWEQLSLEQFKAMFRKSAVQRTKFEGLKRNILFQKNKNNQPGKNL